MPPWLGVWIRRWVAGERLEKAKPRDYRMVFGFFLLMPVFMLVFGVFGGEALDSSSGLVLWVWTSIAMGVFLALLFAWSKFVPAAVSIILGLPAWAGLAYWFYHR